VRTEIELVVGGTIIDLNRILLPPDTPIIDRRSHGNPIAESRKGGVVRRWLI